MDIDRTRITADIDTTNKFIIAFNVFKALANIKKINLIELTPSPSKTGYHLTVFSGKRYSQKDIFKLREKIGDDINRIKVDKIRGYNLQTLFYKKDKRGIRINERRKPSLFRKLYKRKR